MVATCHCEFAVPPAPQAGLNNRTASSHTLSPAEKKQEVTDLKLCLPPLGTYFRITLTRKRNR